MSDEQILTVDVAGFERADPAERRATIEAVMTSLKTGFVYARHAIPPALLDESFAALAEFFALPKQVKDQYTAPASHGHTGYTGLLVETGAGASKPDWKEMLNWSSTLPATHPLRRNYPHQYPEPVLADQPPQLPGLLLTLAQGLEDVQRRFMRIVALGIGAHEEFFDDLLTDGAFVSRAIHYPPMHESGGRATIWADEHADIDLVTALPRPSGKGLEVLTESGWIAATPPEGALILNTGIMLERLTNGLIPAGWHRVIADPSERGERFSIVQFAHPASWYLLAPVPSCVTAEWPCRYGSITAGDLRDRVTWEINMIPATV